MRRWFVRLGLLGAAASLAALALLVGGTWFYLQANPLGGAGKPVIVTVKAGDSLTRIADELASAGVIHSALALRADLLIFGAPTVLPGSYEIDQNSSFSSLKHILGAGPNVASVNVTAGLTLHEVALQVASATTPHFAETFLHDAAAAAAASA